jgi:hypothetical protein
MNEAGNHAISVWLRRHTRASNFPLQRAAPLALLALRPLSVRVGQISDKRRMVMGLVHTGREAEP